MNAKLLAIVFLTASAPLITFAVDPADTSYTGAIYVDFTSDKSLFSIERSWRTESDKKILTEAFKNNTGNTVAVLESTYVENRLASIYFEQKQTSETATAKFKDGRVFYSTTIKGKTKESDEGVAGEWAAFNAVPEYIVKHWATLADGSVIKCRIPIPLMRDSFEFALSRTRVWIENGRSRSEFKLESSSVLIRMLADPMFYVLDDGDKSLLEYRGRTIVKMDEGGKLKNLDATIKYRAGLR